MNFKNGKSKKLLGDSFELNLFATVALVFGIASVSKELIPIFFGEGYDACIFLTIIFTPVLFVKSLSIFICMQYLIPQKQERVYIIAAFSGAAINLIASALLIKPLGAVAGIFIAESAVCMIQFRCIRGQQPVGNYFSKNIFCFADGIVMLLIVRQVGHIPISGIVLLFLEIVTGAIVYIALCLICWKFNNQSIFHNEIGTILKRKLLL